MGVREFPISRDQSAAENFHVVRIAATRLTCLGLSMHRANLIGNLCGSALPVGIGHPELDRVVTLPFQQRNFRTLTEPQ